MFMHDTCTAVKSTVEEHKGIKTSTCCNGCFKVIFCKRINLSLKLIGDNNRMPLTN